MSRPLQGLVRVFPLEKFLRDRGVRFTERSRYISLARCLNCGKKEKMIINKHDRFFKCFVCNEKGSLVKFISLVEQISFNQALSLLGKVPIYTKSQELEGLNSLQLLNENGIEEEIEEIPEVTMPISFDRVKINSDSNGANYLRNVRGYSQELVDLFDIRYSEYSKRVIFPIRDHNRRLVGWQGRDVTGTNPIKILTQPSGLKKSLLLYNFHSVKEESCITLVEGPIDCHKAYQCNAIATFGKLISDDQLTLLMLSDNLQTVNIGLDPDAQKERSELASLLAPFYQVKMVELPRNRKDLGDCSVEEATYYIDNAIDYNKHSRKLVSTLR